MTTEERKAYIDLMAGGERTWFDTWRTEMEGDAIDRVTLELETIRLLYDRLRMLGPEGRVRVLRYVEGILGEE